QMAQHERETLAHEAVEPLSIRPPLRLPLHQSVYFPLPQCCSLWHLMDNKTDNCSHLRTLYPVKEMLVFRLF
uniref:Uncharacterized protein n=1 Tax=Athene cunicularia TaxID=194338 RepID=A0A663MA45_ATHCN